MSERQTITLTPRDTQTEKRYWEERQRVFQAAIDKAIRQGRIDLITAAYQKTWFLFLDAPLPTGTLLVKINAGNQVSGQNYPWDLNLETESLDIENVQGPLRDFLARKYQVPKNVPICLWRNSRDRKEGINPLAIVTNK